MKIFLVLSLILIASVAAAAQQAPPPPPSPSIIERVDLSGLDEAKLSAELRADIQKLVGQPYNAQAIEALTQDIQVEFPEYVAAGTTQPGSQEGRVVSCFSWQRSRRTMTSGTTSIRATSSTRSSLKASRCESAMN